MLAAARILARTAIIYADAALAAREGGDTA
jgi:hypothetical protein